MKDITLTVYFSGTAHPIDSNQWMAGVLHNATRQDEQHAKMGFDGCGVEYGFCGSVFGSGLEAQCQQVIDNVVGLLKAGKRVRLNAYGHSRGAIAVLLLAKKLGKFDRDLLEVNLVLIDPVPGNLISTAAIDFTHLTLARQAMDVSDSLNLNRVLAIYPHVPLADYSFHAPLIPQYPTHCEVTEEIVPGCHAQAQLMSATLTGANRAAKITFSLVTKFLAQLGTSFSFLRAAPTADEERGMRNKLLHLYNETFKAQKKSALHYSRPCHAQSTVAIQTEWPANYLSLTHKKLLQQAHDIVPDEKSNDSQDYAYFFSRKKSNARVAPVNLPEPALELADKAALFAELLNQIHAAGMSSKSQNSSKGSLIQECVVTFQTPDIFSNEEEFKDAMRNALALCLQRDRNALSPFSTTRSGLAAKTLLNSKKYRALANMILNSDDKEIRYRDLRTFVLGSNDVTYFNAIKSQAMYQFFQPKEMEQGHKPKLLANNMDFYLAPRR